MTMRLLYLLVGGFLCLSGVVFVSLLRTTVPYGRHTRSGWGPTMSARLGWLVMELPAPVVMAILFVLGTTPKNAVLWVFLLLWELHYVNRSLVFPFRIRGDRKQMTLTVVVMAFFFNIVNGYLNGLYLFTLAEPYAMRWFVDPRFIVGVLMFLGGFIVNQISDRILRSMRKKNGGESSYGIPEGLLFNRISCPNYLGEMVEWLGWAVLTWSLPGLAFFVWTAANLIPRAISHHRWYHSTFEEYPKQRTAVIPYVL